jgi:hypothetical protein
MSPRERAVWMLFLAILIGVLLGAGGETAAVFRSIPTDGRHQIEPEHQGQVTQPPQRVG